MSESQWSYLGLSHNPFSEPRLEFFPGADRETQVSKIRHLNQWSRRILAITGPHGVGKTSMFRNLSSSLQAGVHAARINGSLVSRANDVLGALFQGFGVTAPDDVNPAVLIELLSAHLVEQKDTKRSNLVLVDDAHLLEQRAVDDLVSLVDAGAHVLFFSEPQFVEVLERAVERAGARDAVDQPLWSEMLVSPFTRAQTDDYLEWRFAEAGYKGKMPFNESQVEEIFAASKGFPGRIDQSANEQLVTMTLGESRPGGMPTRHMYLAAGIAAAVGLVLWLWSPGAQEDEVPPAAVASAPPKAIERDTPRVPATAADADSVPRPAQALAAAPADVPIPVPIPEPIPEQKAAPGPSAAERQSALARAVAQADRLAAEQAASAAADDAEIDVDVVATVDVTPQKQQLESVRDAAWLLGMDAQGYTIQLIGFSDASRARAYVDKQDDPGVFVLFKTRARDRIVHVVTYGYFSDRLSAERAAAKLPETVGKISPWVRPMKSVHAGIRSALQGE